MIESVANNFIIYGDYVKSQPFGSGHINDTRLVTFNQAGMHVKYIFRRINKNVFKYPEIVINNTILIAKQINDKLKQSDEKDISRKVVTLVSANNGKYYYKDEKDDYWCALLFVENAFTVDFVETIDQAYNAAKAFGKFTKQIIDIDVSKIEETIPNFHNLKNRLDAFDSAAQVDVSRRVVLVSDEIFLVQKNRNLANKISNLLNREDFPVRIVHNDTKINNIMLDGKTGVGLAVIDLDTVMPGTVLFDFGDMIRSSTNPVAEDDTDIHKVKMEISVFEAVVKGYLSELNEDLTNIEINNLVFGVEVIVYEQAVRFLTDYIMGDVYYGKSFEDHNLIRAKNQFALLDSIQNQKHEMEEIIKKYI